MDICRAREILAALAEGVDPTTGELLPEESVYNKGDVVRALHAILAVLDKKTAKKNLPENTGKSWSGELDQCLKYAYNSGMPIKEIAHMMGRTTGSISSRLIKLGLINISK